MLRPSPYHGTQPNDDEMMMTFASIAVSAIGLMSFSIHSGGRFLGNGITVAVFHNFGSTPSRRESCTNR